MVSLRMESTLFAPPAGPESKSPHEAIEAKRGSYVDVNEQTASWLERKGYAIRAAAKKLAPAKPDAPEYPAAEPFRSEDKPKKRGK